MNCRSCGQRISLSDNFCQNCGKKIDWDEYSSDRLIIEKLLEKISSFQYSYDEQTGDVVGLDLSGCKLESVPDEVWDLKALRSLNLFGNKIN